MIDFFFAAVSLAALVWLYQKNARRYGAQEQTHRSWLVKDGVPKPTPDDEPEAPKPPAVLDYNAINRAYRIADMRFLRGDFEEAEKWFQRKAEAKQAAAG